MQRIVCSAQLFLIHQPSQRIETSATHFFGHVGRIEARLDRLFLDLAHKIHVQMACPFNLEFMWVEFFFNKCPCRVDDHGLFFGHPKLHGALHI